MHKALRSLAKRLPYKVTKFEDAKDFQRMNLEELMGSIRRFGMNLDEENNINIPAGIRNIQRGGTDGADGCREEGGV